MQASKQTGRAKKVVLAYSGGVDTTACIPYLKHEMGVEEVITLAADLGQGDELEQVQKKALIAGASMSLVVDAKDAFLREYALPALKANALYENRYPLTSALGRPLIAKLIVEAAEKYGADAVAHGCTGKGNDQVRFDLSVAILNPTLKVLAPAREWGMSREETIAYSERFGIASTVTKAAPYAIDLNILGRNIEAGPLEELWHEPTEEVFALTKALEDTPDQPAYAEITFEKGVPIKLNNTPLSLLALFTELNQLAGSHGVGRIDMMENRLVGIKSREIYEAPAFLTLIKAHQDLESLTLTADVTQFKRSIEDMYSKLVYNGLWYSPLKEALDAFVQKTQERVSGTVRLKLFKGHATVVGRHSTNSLYAPELSHYLSQIEDKFDHKAAEGFIYIWGMQSRIWAETTKYANQESFLGKETS